MPMYGFICEDCNEDFEELVMSTSKISEVACPSCGSQHVERQLSLVAGLKTSGAGSSSSAAACSPGGG